MRRSETSTGEVLFAGNSQGLCLQQAYEAQPELLAGHEVSFLIKPGGNGPYLLVNEDGTLHDRLPLPEIPPRFIPAEVATTPVHAYDLIVVGALGFVDGGWIWDLPMTRQGQVLAFGPVEGATNLPPVSKHCYRQMMHDILGNEWGVVFLRGLHAKYRGRILVQEMPYLSASAAEHPDWFLRRLYRDPVGMYRFLIDCNGEFMRRLCQELKLPLLPNPWLETPMPGFTTPELMAAVDAFHALPAYGAKVLKQVANYVAKVEAKERAKDPKSLLQSVRSYFPSSKAIEG